MLELFVSLFVITILVVAMMFVPLKFGDYHTIPVHTCVPIAARRFLIKHHWAKINRENCEAALTRFANICEKYNVKFYLASGTALGCVREGDFIPNDSDIDVGMFPDAFAVFQTLLPLFQKQGYFLYKHYSKVPRFVTLVYQGESLDVSETTPTGHCEDLPGPCEELWPTLEPFRTVQLRGRSYTVPSQAYVEYLYGKNWNVPLNEKAYEINERLPK